MLDAEDGTRWLPIFLLSLIASLTANRIVRTHEPCQAVFATHLAEVNKGPTVTARDSASFYSPGELAS